MKASRFLLIGCLLLAGCVNKDGLCVDKFVIDDAGEPRYYAIIRDKSGHMEQHDMLLEDYERAEKGRIFIFP